MKKLLLVILVAASIMAPTASAATVDVVLVPSITGQLRYCLYVTPEAGESGSFGIVIREPSGKRYKAISGIQMSSPSETWHSWCVPVTEYEAAGGFGWTYEVKLDRKVVASGEF
jgi:hypothetical protein